MTGRGWRGIRRLGERARKEAGVPRESRRVRLPFSAVPSGLVAHPPADPALERWAILVVSLRDTKSHSDHISAMDISDVPMAPDGDLMGFM